MNILFLTTHLNTGGITTYLYTLTKGLRAAGHKVFLVSSGGNRVDDFLKLGAHHEALIVRTKFEFDLRNYPALKRLTKIIKENKIDIIHANTRVTQVMAAYLSRKTGCPFVSTCHGFFTPKFARRLLPAWGLRVVAISPAVAAHLKQDFGLLDSQVALIANGIDTAEFRAVDETVRRQKKQELQLGEGPVIGIIARLSDVKGHDVLIKAMPDVVKEFPNAKLVIAGEGKMEASLKALVQELQLQSNIVFFPLVNQTAELLTAFDVFVLPSLQEGLGLSAMEAQAAGLPVVASRVGGLPDLIKEGHTGLLVEPKAAAALTRAILVLLKDKRLANEIGQNARQFISEHFSAQQMVAATVEFYKEAKAERILVVNVNWLGDCIFSAPVFKALKKAYPQSQISCLAVPRVKEILERIWGVDRVIVYDEKGIHASPLGKWKLIKELRTGGFHKTFLLHKSMTRALLVFLAGIPERVGYNTKGRGIFLTHKINPVKTPRHRSDDYLGVIESYGVKVEDRCCEIRVEETAKEEIRKTLKRHNVDEGDFMVVVNPGGNWDLKRWDRRNFARLIGRLVRELNAKVVLPGAPQDKELVETIARLSEADPVILAGQTGLGQLAALMQRANLVIAADTGPLHLAHSVGAKIVGLFGPTRPEITGPRGRGAAVILQNDVGCNREACYFLSCPDNVCMQSINVEDVMQSVKQMMT